MANDLPPVASGDGRLEALAGTIAACRACTRLVEWREQARDDRRGGHLGENYWARPLPGFGDVGAGLLLVGLAPAAHGANRTGRLFTGDRSGDFLFAALHRTGYANQAASHAADDGLTLTGAFVTAPVRCAPPDNKPSVAERERCAPFFSEELELLPALRCYLALGAFAYEALWRVEALRPEGRSRPKFAHGLEVPLRPGSSGAPRTLLCAYHPSQRNVFTGLLRPEMLDAVLVRARALCVD